MSDKCIWTENNYDYSSWEASCGGAYCMEYDFRNEPTGYNYCPNCGRKLEIAPIPKEEDDEP